MTHKKWKYLKKDIDECLSWVECNHLGEEGWELCGIYPSYKDALSSDIARGVNQLISCIFKRPYYDE